MPLLTSSVVSLGELVLGGRRFLARSVGRLGQFHLFSRVARRGRLGTVTLYGSLGVLSLNSNVAGI